jgi:hypothetical protein
VASAAGESMARTGRVRWTREGGGGERETRTRRARLAQADPRCRALESCWTAVGSVNGMYCKVYGVVEQLMHSQSVRNAVS